MKNFHAIYLLLAQWWWCRWWRMNVVGVCRLLSFHHLHHIFIFFHCGIYLKSPHVRYLQFGIGISAPLTFRRHQAKMYPLFGFTFLRIDAILPTNAIPTWCPTAFCNFVPIDAVFLHNSHEAFWVKRFLKFPWSL